ncbi:MAG: alpha-L-fucosidase [Prevotella sp.]|nr:alpha-L-fucosidase [Prevotella sp.]
MKKSFNFLYLIILYALLLFIPKNDVQGAGSGDGEAPAQVLPVPEPKQVRWQQMETYAFIHYGLNTYNDMEWGYGDASPRLFNPTRLDTDQWVRTLKAAGMKGVIFTAKHHDGFCLWPSQYSDYTIAQSPYRGGKGDVVGELAASCRKYGLKLGLYLSPWDRHQASYGTAAYVDYYHLQLAELLKRYGPLFEVWFDGANGGDGWYGGANERRSIDQRTYYDFPRAYDTLARLSPETIVFSDGGPGCRWVGNERGEADATNWSMLRHGEVHAGFPRPKELSTGHADGDEWVPAECDVSIRPGWFWHEKENSQVKTPRQLLDIYYKSVGRNATFLLNVPVAGDGRIHPADSLSLMGFRELLKQEFACNLVKEAHLSANAQRGQRYAVANVADGSFDSFWTCADDGGESWLQVSFQKPTAVSRLMLQEYIPLGQRVCRFVVECRLEEQTEWLPVDCGEPTTTIGYKRLLRFTPVEAKELRIRFTDVRACACISELGVY